MFSQRAILIGVLSIILTIQCATSEPRLATRKEIKSLSESLHNFSYKMLNTINMATPNENVFFSPISTYHALLLTYFGSRGETEEYLKQGLSLNWAKSKEEVMNTYHHQRIMLEQKSSIKDLEFSLADKVYISSNFKIRDSIQDDLSHAVESLNFQDEPEEARKIINDFVEKETRNNIQDILVPGSIASDTNLVVANAAYFKGDWVAKFNKTLTKKDVFHPSTNENIFTDMMSQTGSFEHCVSEALNVHILKMPFKGEKAHIAMYVFLPPLVTPSGHSGSTDGVTNFLKLLNYETLLKEMNQVYAKKVSVKLPKFSYEKSLELVPILRQMEIGDLFQGSANLTGFIEDGNLSLGDAIHKAKIKVDEEGSTAAAATVLFSFRSSRPLDPTQFFCTQPFVFMIYDTKENLILFSGIYRRPE